MKKSGETHKIIEHFPELNIKVREATEGFFKILEDVKSKLKTEAIEYSIYKKEYIRLYNIIDTEIKKYNGVKKERAIRLLIGIQDGINITAQGHKLGYDTLVFLDPMIELSEPDRQEIYLIE